MKRAFFFVALAVPAAARLGSGSSGYSSSSSRGSSYSSSGYSSSSHSGGYSSTSSGGYSRSGGYINYSDDDHDFRGDGTLFPILLVFFLNYQYFQEGARWALPTLVVVLGLMVFVSPGTGMALVGLELLLYVLLKHSAAQSARSIDEFHTEAHPTNLGPILAVDANFSRHCFQEFVVLLYSQAMSERHRDFPQSLPYLSKNVRPMLFSPDPVRDVVVGSCKFQNVALQGRELYVTLELDSNFVENVQGRDQHVSSLERWTFVRAAGVLSKEPAQATRLGCPNCGFGGEFPSSGVCPQCSTLVQPGRQDWSVARVQVVQRNVVPAIERGTVEEVGTDNATVRHPQLVARRKEFNARHPEFSWEAFSSQVLRMFTDLQNSWTSRNWSGARPHETDSLFRTHRYWIDHYLRSGQVNVLRDLQILKLDLSNIETDAFYEAVTFRIFAQMTDYTVQESNGQVLSGDPKTPRRFSEYWTFMRRVGSGKKPFQPAHCPACAAPLDRINQAGVCEYCDNLITRGDFDWVVCQIQQDEIYVLGA